MDYIFLNFSYKVSPPNNISQLFYLIKEFSVDSSFLFVFFRIIFLLTPHLYGLFHPCSPEGECEVPSFHIKSSEDSIHSVCPQLLCTILSVDFDFCMKDFTQNTKLSLHD